ncbi:MAG: cobalamin biosynthesis protein CbiA [Deltaproteobacteria bacterium]|nr:MAG: cobalamin biosynthesis protein CbiA [Deltaproteobacteria bacterium]
MGEKKIDLDGIVIIVGNYGSGKTEVAVNLAVYHRRGGMTVQIADLDLVNPYFRAREARIVLEAMGIDVVLPPDRYMQADLPILSPRVSGMIRNPGGLALLDAGGDDVGVTVLASLAGHLKGRKVRMLQVINPFRPFTETVEGCLKIGREIEASAKMTINGIVGNANLIDETDPETIYSGYDVVRQVSVETGLQLEFVTADINLLPGLDLTRFECPVLPIERQLVPPWKKAAQLQR